VHRRRRSERIFLLSELVHSSAALLSTSTSTPSHKEKRNDLFIPQIWRKFPLLSKFLLQLERRLKGEREFVFLFRKLSRSFLTPRGGTLGGFLFLFAVLLLPPPPSPTPPSSITAQASSRPLLRPSFASSLSPERRGAFRSALFRHLSSQLSRAKTKVEPSRAPALARSGRGPNQNFCLSLSCSSFACFCGWAPSSSSSSSSSFFSSADFFLSWEKIH